MTMKKPAVIYSLGCFPFALWANGQRPNIIVFLVDDMGVMDSSVPFLTQRNGVPEVHPLNRFYRTPHLEELSRRGTRFSTFYAQSVSSPSRVSLLTGQNAARHGTTNWIQSESNNRTPYGPHRWNWRGLTCRSVVYPRLLQQAGYRTIHVGKAHFGPMGSEGENPLHLGFDVNVGGSSIGEPGSYFGEDAYGLRGGTRSRAVPDLEAYHGTSTFLTDALTNRALEEIEKSIQAGKPFYLNLAHYAVHSPFQADPRFVNHYTDAGKSAAAVAFATLIEGMDASLGKLLEKLDTLGEAENTLIIFLGDNGGDAPLGDAAEIGTSAPLRGKKGSEFEGGVRAPLLVAWARPNPSHPLQARYPVCAHQICSQMVTIMDLFPTILSVAGVEPLEHHELDGSDLKPLLAGKCDRSRRNDFLLHFPHEHRGSYFTTYRKGDWKLIYYYRPESALRPSCQLYHLKKDPFEQQNVAALQPRRLKRLFREMVARLKEEGAFFPVDADGKELTPDEGMIRGF